MYEAYVITESCTPARVPDTLSGRDEIICVVINAVAADVMFSQVLSVVEKGCKH